MKYYSINSINRKSPEVNFKEALMRGLAPDGGLYMPAEWAKAQSTEWKVKSVGEFVGQILNEFIDIPIADLKKITKNAFNFPVPLVKLDKNLYILELFHGPTLSFKDFGARFMARAMNYYAKRTEEREKRKVKINIIVATSGDTGSAVASAFYGLKNIKVFVLYPARRISQLQEKQIATLGKNIVALEIKGDFDDCQRLAKKALADQGLRKRINLSSANSINIGRLLPQMYYYFVGYQQYRKAQGAKREASNDSRLALSDSPVFVVPSGNFGNLTAGLFAKRCGLPVKKFIAAVNINSCVPEYLQRRQLPIKKTVSTMSNAMDVGKPSNWARILNLYQSGEIGSPRRSDLQKLKQDLEAITATEAETKKTIREIYRKYGYLVDPHTAVGIAAAKKSSLWLSSPVIVLATAHPAKFREIVEAAIGKKIKLPPPLAQIQKKKKISVKIGTSYEELCSHLR